MANILDRPDQVRVDEDRAKRATRGAAIGFYIDMFDVYLPVIALGPAMIYFVSANLSVGAKSLIASAIFAATLVARPIGSTLFGVLADRVGRRRSTLLAVVGCGVTTTLTAFLPGYQHWGMAAVVLLVIVRFVGGIFMGGEYTGAIPLAMESAPIAKRGWIGGVIAAAFPVAYCTIAGISFLLLEFMPAGGLMSTYVQWGWRIPFLIGGVITFWFAWYYARSVEESPSWQQSKEEITAESPMKTLLRGANRRALIRIFVLMTGVWFGSNVVTVILPATVRELDGIGASTATGMWIIAQIVLTAGYLGAGLLSQRIGRRNFFVVCGVSMATVSAVCVSLIATATVTGAMPVLLVSIIALLGASTTFGSVSVMVCENFPVDVRGTGYGLGYSLAIIIPSFYAVYQELLTSVVPRDLTPAVLLVLGGVLVVIGALLGSDTRDRDLSLTTRDLEAAGRL
jgi:MFS family permease